MPEGARTSKGTPYSDKALRNAVWCALKKRANLEIDLLVDAGDMDKAESWKRAMRAKAAAYEEDCMI